MYKILLAKSAQKTYQRLPPKLQKGVDRCIEYLRISPRHTPNTKELKGVPGCYRYQVGGWRILYEVNDVLNEVRIYEIGPRGDIYKH